MLPSQRYQQLLQQANYKADPLQAQAVLRLDALYKRALARKRWYVRSKQIKGIYLWGRVGIGKSFLTDLFFDCLPDIGKTREHYQHFMARIHRELNAVTGVPNPLKHIGRKLAAEFKVICIDELYITDLGDAMIVHQLFTSLFEEGVAVLITSNFAIENLYKDDLQPRIFQPAIQLFKAHTEEVHLQSTEDYRRLHQDDHPTWYTGDEQDFALLFDELNFELQQRHDYSVEPFPIQQHLLRAMRHSGGIAWLTFEELCEKPRSAKDYILLGQRFNIMLVSGVPQFGGGEGGSSVTIGTEDGMTAGQRRQYSSNENAQRRFISLVDECYDQGFKLHVLAAVPLVELYAGGRFAFEFQRTLSRLAEMQSAAYRDKALRNSRK